MDRLHSPNSATVSVSINLPSMAVRHHHSLVLLSTGSPLLSISRTSILVPMYIKNGGKGKRKVGEFPAEPTPGGHQVNLFNLHGQHFASPSVPQNSHPSQVHRILNGAASMKPFSYMSLLMGEDDDDIDPLSEDTRGQREQIDQMILLHSENLKQAIGGMLDKHHRNIHHVAEERAAKKLRERDLELRGQLARNAELERMVEHYKGQAQRLLIRVQTLERTTIALHERLQEANAARRYAEAMPEEAESSFGDPDCVGPIRLDCKVCGRQLATVMIWPCRHVCICKRCEGATHSCPVCHLVKTASTEVHLPLN